MPAGGRSRGNRTRKLRRRRRDVMESCSPSFLGRARGHGIHPVEPGGSSGPPDRQRAAAPPAGRADDRAHGDDLRRGELRRFRRLRPRPRGAVPRLPRTARRPAQPRHLLAAVPAARGAPAGPWHDRHGRGDHDPRRPRQHAAPLPSGSVPVGAVRFAAAVRAHWRIENSLHWVLDVGFDEDRARNRRDHGAENLATLRKLALNLLRSARPGTSIRGKRKRSGRSDEFARSLLGRMR